LVSLLTSSSDSDLWVIATPMAGLRAVLTPWPMCVRLWPGCARAWSLAPG
jgi:hypothetical protein